MACNCQTMLERQGGEPVNRRQWPGYEKLRGWCRMARMQLRSCDLASGKRCLSGGRCFRDGGYVDLAGLWEVIGAEEMKLERTLLKVFTT